MVNQLSLLQKLQQKGTELRKKGSELLALWTEFCELSKEYESLVSTETKSDDVSQLLHQVQAENQRLKAKLTATELKLKKMHRAGGQSQNDGYVMKSLPLPQNIIMPSEFVVSNGSGAANVIMPPVASTNGATSTDDDDGEAEAEAASARVVRKRKSSANAPAEPTEKRTRPSRTTSPRSLRSSTDSHSPVATRTTRTRDQKPSTESTKSPKSSAKDTSPSRKTAKSEPSDSESKSETEQKNRRKRGLPPIKLKEPKVEPKEVVEVEEEATKPDFGIGTMEYESVDWSQSVAMQIAAEAASQVYRCMMCSYPPFKRPGDLVRHIKMKHAKEWV